MNYSYAHLIGKYFPEARVTIQDRTYEGIIWHGPGEKPTKELFEAFAREEDRQAGIMRLKQDAEMSVLKERQHQARVQAERDAIPLMEKIRASEEEIRDEVLTQKLIACELSERAKTRDSVLDSWQEITLAQAIFNEEHEKYLADTDWYVTRELETKIAIPGDVKEKRRIAREKINYGKTVYARYRELREQEMPSKEELRKAILEGGEVLENMKNALQSVKLKYPRPKKNF